MALSLLTTPVANVTTITAALWIAEFNNIYNNSLSLISPLTGDLAAGGNKITGLSLGTLASPALQFTGDTNTGIYSSTAGSVSIVGNANAVFAITDSTPVQAFLEDLSSGASGPNLNLLAFQVTPADGDIPGTITFIANDASIAQRTVANIQVLFDDVDETSMDSHFLFGVMDNVNGGNCATFAQLTSLGVWQDASAAAGKKYIGDVTGVLDKIKQLKSLGVYVGATTPEAKMPTAERHLSPTAEDFYAVFGLGKNPALTQTPGIAPKDVAWLAVKAVLELESRVATLEAA